MFSAVAAWRHSSPRHRDVLLLLLLEASAPNAEKLAQATLSATSSRVRCSQWKGTIGWLVEGNVVVVTVTVCFAILGRVLTPRRVLAVVLEQITAGHTDATQQEASELPA